MNVGDDLRHWQDTSPSCLYASSPAKIHGSRIEKQLQVQNHHNILPSPFTKKICQTVFGRLPNGIKIHLKFCSGSLAQMMIYPQGEDTGVPYSCLSSTRLANQFSSTSLSSTTCVLILSLQGAWWSQWHGWRRTRNTQYKGKPTRCGCNQAKYILSCSLLHQHVYRTRERVIPPSTSSGSSESEDEEEEEEERAVSSRGRVRRPNPRLFD